MTTFKDRIIQAFEDAVAQREAEEQRLEQERIDRETSVTKYEFSRVFGELPDRVYDTEAEKDGVTLVRSRNHRGLWYVRVPCVRCGNPASSQSCASVVDIGRVLKDIEQGTYSMLCYDCQQKEG